MLFEYESFEWISVIVESKSTTINTTQYNGVEIAIDDVISDINNFAVVIVDLSVAIGQLQEHRCT